MSCSLDTWLPNHWSYSGYLPLSDPLHYAVNKNLLDIHEDVCQFLSPTGRFTIDIGWWPDSDPKGNYICRVLTTDGLIPPEDNPWSQPPIEEFETKDTGEMLKWLASKITLYHEILCKDEDENEKI